MSETDSATWDDVREAKIQVVVEQARRVIEVDARCAATTRELNAAHAAVGRAIEARDAAFAERDKWRQRVKESVESYQHIGKEGA